MKYILDDYYTTYNNVDAIITTVTSEQRDIEDAIGKIKQQEEYGRRDLEDALPDDCTIEWLSDFDGRVCW